MGILDGRSPEYPAYAAAAFGLRSTRWRLRLPRRHAVTYRDVLVPGDAYRPPLPASGNELSFTLPLGLAPPAEWQVEATIEVLAAPGAGTTAAGGFR